MTINGLLTETTRHYVPPDRTVYEVFKKKKLNLNMITCLQKYRQRNLLNHDNEPANSSG